MTTGLQVNVRLGSIFGEAWRRVRKIDHEGREMYMAHDICEILDIRNVTTGIRGVDNKYRVDLVNRDKVYVPTWTPRRRVYVLTIEGVFQLIINNKTAECRTIKKFIACRHLPEARALKLHDSATR